MECVIFWDTYKDKKVVPRKHGTTPSKTLYF
jgi:hypothetical protein